MKKSEIHFWLFFFLLNFLLFLPRYILTQDSTSFFPFGFLQAEDWFNAFKYFFNRFNYDIFRITPDLVYVVSILYLFRSYLKITVASLLLTMFYLILLVYQLYYNAFEVIYHVNPLLFNDLHAINTGQHIVFEHISFSLILVFIGILSLIIGLFIAIRHFLKVLQQLTFGRVSLYIISGLAIVLLYSQFRYGFRYLPGLAFPNISASIVKNIHESLVYKRASQQIDANRLIAQNDILPVQLKKEPNIFLIFVESYGRYVYDNSSLTDRYVKNLRENESKLHAHGWSVASVLSTSPISGGISWVSYSSVLYGFNMKNQGLYNYFLDNDTLNEFIHFTKYFRKQGYKNYRLNAVYPHENLVIPWDKYSRFYAVDEWITFEDLQYNGKMYGFGPAPPDQYSLNYAVEEIIDTYSQPFTLFYITQNSHTPFCAPDSVSNNWRTLNSGSSIERPESVFIQKPNNEDYIKSIEYQIDFISDFICRSDSNNIFLVIGDHQPPHLTTENDGFETPVHIIAKDTSFISGFTEYGFNNGYIISSRDEIIHHEGIYSLFMREFLRNYANIDSLPVYRPKGIQIYE
ncbi:MAG: sulfatase-like hydrolase/transferase [Bacteroidetes bacterium]|jgi:hypothetical protein|nr:sulfatase-like hydrolase/transferase [Bacteroidota bacterium]